MEPPLEGELGLRIYMKVEGKEGGIGKRYKIEVWLQGRGEGVPLWV